MKKREIIKRLIEAEQKIDRLEKQINDLVGNLVLIPKWVSPGEVKEDSEAMKESFVGCRFEITRDTLKAFQKYKELLDRDVERACKQSIILSAESISKKGD